MNALPSRSCFAICIGPRPSIQSSKMCLTTLAASSSTIHCFGFAGSLIYPNGGRPFRCSLRFPLALLTALMQPNRIRLTGQIPYRNPVILRSGNRSTNQVNLIPQNDPFQDRCYCTNTLLCFQSIQNTLTVFGVNVLLCQFLHRLVGNTSQTQRSHFVRAARFHEIINYRE